MEQEQELDITPSKLIRDYDESERPREKALENGIDTLSDVELMALIFSTGIKGKSVIDLCAEIIKDNDNSLWRITNMTIKEISAKYKGIGIAKATTLLAGLTLGKRAAAERDKILASQTVNTSHQVYFLMREKLKGLQHEEFWITLFNRAGKYIGAKLISQGGTAATTVDVKIIMKTALDHLVSSIILIHNHPSGTLRPSVEDDRLTKKIVDAASFFDIRVNDHLIITDASYYSYADNGRL